MKQSYIAVTCTLVTFAATGVAFGGSIMDQIGNADGSDVTVNLYACQYFEEAYAQYDVAMLDDFDNASGAVATHVSAVIGGWNNYAGLDAVQGAQLNFYTAVEEAGASLTGYVSADFDVIAGDPSWPDGATGDLVTVSGGPWAINGGVGYVALIPINEYATNGQTGLAGSNLGDGAAWQANPGGGFGFGPWQDLVGNAAYRIEGQSGDPCNAALPQQCAADVSGPSGVPDDIVTVEDLLAIIAHFGETGDGTFRPIGDCAPLPTGDCIVAVDDLLMCIGEFGNDCTPTGACCNGFNPCEIGTEADCDANGGGYSGDDSSCETCAYGACCYEDGSCTELYEGVCANSGGSFNLDATCDQADCQPIAGACCLGPQTCIDGLTPADCDAFAGEFAGDGSSCLDAPCGWPGCDAKDTPEGLPCQEDTTADDFYDENGGTNSDPPAYGSIADGETICGMMSTFLCIGCADDGTDVNYRDTDWYRFDNPEGGTYTVRAGGDGALLIGIIRISAGSFVSYVFSESHEQTEFTVTLGAGDDYAVFVAHDWNSETEVPCSSGNNEYTVSLFGADAPAAACCVGLECAGDLVPLDCDALGGTYVSDESCNTYACPEAYQACDTGYGQDPFLTGWWAGTSDTGAGYVRYENINAPTITNLRIWGITAIYSGGWSACSDLEMNFEVASFEDDGTGAPGNLTGELVGWVADQAPLEVDFGGYTLSRFDFPLQATVPSRWIKAASNGNGCWFLWICSSDDGAGSSLVENGGAFETIARDLSYCITP